MRKIYFTFCLVLLSMVSAAQTRHTLPPLPYPDNALEPVMSTETIKFHHGKHVQTYVDNLNKLIPGTPYENASLDEISRTATGSIYNNGAQILNHIIFFNGFAPQAIAQDRPTGSLAVAIDQAFGSFDGFKQKFVKEASEQFGSGWAWLVTDQNGNLSIMKMPNAENPLKDGLTPILGIDVWEHSYYIDYRNSRADYLNNIWQIVDWKVISKRYDRRDHNLR